MTRKARRQQRRDIQADYERGMSKDELRDKYHISIQSVYRALMSDQAYDHMIAQAQVRKERASLRVPKQGDRLLYKLRQVFGEPRNEIAPELQKMRYA